MPYLNVEIKAHCANPATIRKYLQDKRADYKGTDSQIDTYFNALNGRLKLREGRIENNLIYYERSNQQGPKDSFFQLVKVEDASGLKEVLTASLGVKVVVIKKREIYFIENVKFHIDDVPGLGSFVEIEASNLYKDLSSQKLKEQCDYYMAEFEIQRSDLIANSYSDLLI